MGRGADVGDYGGAIEAAAKEGHWHVVNFLTRHREEEGGDDVAQ